MSDQPGYTRVPNALLEIIATLPDAECRVMLVIVRRTFGWNKPNATISIKDFTDATKMSRQGVLNGIEAAITRGLITRSPAGYNNGYTYQVVNEVDPLQVVNEVDQSTKWTTSSQRSRPLVVNEVDHLTPDLPHQEALNDMPKEIYKEKERKYIADDAQSAPPPHTKPARTRKPKADPDSPLAVRQALADTCAIEYGRHGPKEPKLQVNTVAGKLWKAAQEKGATEAQVIEGIKTTAAYCRRAVYPYKDGQPLTPGAIHKHWKAAIEERDRTRARGNGAYVNGASAPSALAALSPADVADGAEIARLFRQGGGR